MNNINLFAKTINIILIGLMGSGKTSVGKQLAQRLNWDFIDTDELIEREAGITITEIFSQQGEQHFRNLETHVIRELLAQKNIIISTGGGIVLREENIVLLKQLGKVVLLWVDPAIAAKRLSGNNQRPLLKNVDPVVKLEEILSLRKEFHPAAADIKIDTSALNVAAVVDKILEELNGSR